MKAKKQRLNLNISDALVRKAQNLFPDKTKTELFTNGLQRLVDSESVVEYFKKYSGKVHLKSYD